MQIAVISLPAATERRAAMAGEFQRLGLEFRFVDAVDGSALTSEQLAMVDFGARREMGLYPQATGSIANWLTQMGVFREFAKGEDATLAVFEDDARLDGRLPSVFAALDRDMRGFDIVKLNRRQTHKRFDFCIELVDGVSIGHVRYSDLGNEGFVISREAARHLTVKFPRMVREIDQVVPRFWENGLRVGYVDPPLVTLDTALDSQIEKTRARSRRQHGEEVPAHLRLRRRLAASLPAIFRRRRIYRKMLKGEWGLAVAANSSRKT